MPIVPSRTTAESYSNIAVPLERYAEIIQLAECAMWGVNNSGDSLYACQDIWTKDQRDQAYKYLAEAQQEIEQVVNYPLSPKYFINEVHYWYNPVLADNSKIIEAGIEATTTISAGAIVDHTNDPAAIGPIVTTVTDENEIRIYHPGSTIEINPSSVTIAGGNVTIEIPRCRMVLAAQASNPATGWDYDDTSNFEATVDVKRVYTDNSTNAELVWPHSCSGVCASNGCQEYTQTACMYIKNAEIGSIIVKPAIYSSGSWTGTNLTCCRGRPQLIRLNYKAGLTTLSPQAEDAIVRLAHSKMPRELCGCEHYFNLWERDRNIPQVLTAERLNCPFGINDGAWVAWQFAQSLTKVRGFAL